MRKKIDLSLMRVNKPRMHIDTPALSLRCGEILQDFMTAGKDFTAFDVTKELRRLNPDTEIPHEDVSDTEPGVAAIVYTLMETYVVPKNLYISTMHPQHQAHYWMPNMAMLKKVDANKLLTA